MQVLLTFVETRPSLAWGSQANDSIQKESTSCEVKKQCRVMMLTPKGGPSQGRQGSPQVSQVAQPPGVTQPTGVTQKAPPRVAQGAQEGTDPSKGVQGGGPGYFWGSHSQGSRGDMFSTW